MPTGLPMLAAATASGLGYYYMKNQRPNMAGFHQKRRSSVTSQNSQSSGGSHEATGPRNWNIETSTDPLSWHTGSYRWNRDMYGQNHWSLKLPAQRKRREEKIHIIGGYGSSPTNNRLPQPEIRNTTFEYHRVNNAGTKTQYQYKNSIPGWNSERQSRKKEKPWKKNKKLNKKPMINGTRFPYLSRM